MLLGVLQEAKAAAAELKTEEEDVVKDIVGGELMRDPHWSDERMLRKAAAEAFWPTLPPQVVLDGI